MTSKFLANYFIKCLLKFDPSIYYDKLIDYSRGSKQTLQFLNGQEEKEVTAGDIAETLSISTARVAKVINNLTKNGYVIRYNSEKDARVSLIKITELGKNYIEKEKNEILFKAEAVIDKVGVKDVMEYIRISKKIKKALKGDYID